MFQLPALGGNADRQARLGRRPDDLLPLYLGRISPFRLRKIFSSTTTVVSTTSPTASEMSPIETVFNKKRKILMAAKVTMIVAGMELTIARVLAHRP